MSNEIDSFEGQGVIVTGGTRGIGKAIALEFLNRGANVVITYSSNDEAVKSLMKEFPQFRGRLKCVRFDVANAGEVKNFFETLPFEQLDVLINNAGIRRDQIVWYDAYRRLAKSY